MKNSLRRLTALLCLFAVLPFARVAAAETQTTAKKAVTDFYESFETETVGAAPQNWEDRKSAATLSVMEENENRFVRISWAEDVTALPMVATKDGVLSVPFNNGTGQCVVVEAKIRMNSEFYRDYLRLNFPKEPSIYDHNGNRYALWYSNPTSATGYFNFLNEETLKGDAWQQPTFIAKAAAESPAVGEWFTYRAVIDTESGTVRHEIDGTHQGNGTLEAAEFSAMTTLSSLVFTWRNKSGLIDPDGAGSMDFDEIHVYRLQDQTEFYEGFETETVGKAPQQWEDRTDPTTLSVMEEEGNKFARVSWTANAATLPMVATKDGVLSIPFKNGEAKRVVIEAKIRMNSAIYRDYLRLNFPKEPSIYDHNGNRYALWYSNPNDEQNYCNYLNGETLKGEAWQQPTFFTKPKGESPAVGEWFTYRAVIDTDTGVVRHEIDGKHQGNGTLEAAEFQTMETLSSIVFTWRNKSGYSATEGAGSMDFDDIRVYTLTDTCNIAAAYTAGSDVIDEPIVGKIGSRLIVTNGTDETKLYAVAARYDERGMLLDMKKSSLQTAAARSMLSVTLPEFKTESLNESFKIFALSEDWLPLMQAEELKKKEAESTDVMTFYVASNGDDTADGSLNAPLATLTGARNAIRAARAAGAEPTDGFCVYLRGGEYQLHEGLHLSAADSGTASAPVVYSAYPNEDVTLVGGAEIAVSAFKKVEDEAFLNRVIDTEARDKILVADLGAMGFNDFGEAFWPGAYSYFMDGLTEPAYPSPELFVDGELQTVARYPNEGFMTVAEVIDAGANPRMWEDDKKGTEGYVEPEERDPNDTFEIRPDDERYKQWTQVPENEALLYGFWRYDWADHTVPLKKVYPEQNKLESGVPSWYSVAEGARFYAFNLPEEIDMPGEYYLDRANKKLYIYPPEGFETADIQLSVLEDDLVTISGASYITLQNIKLTAARGKAVSMNNAADCHIKNCEIAYTADRAVSITSSARCGVADSYIHDVNGGILLNGGNRKTLTAGENYAENNEICRFARLNRTYNAAVELTGVGNRCMHNEMYEAVHLAITFSGNNHLIGYNDIHDVVTENDDMGAIYTGRSWVDRGTQICYNYIHNLTSDRADDHGIYGIYLDDRFCETAIYGNRFEDINGAAVFINGGRDNNVYNNLLVNVSGGFRLRSIVPPDSEADTSNLEKSLTYVPYTSSVWAAAYPNLPNILNDEPSYPKYNKVKNNIALNSGSVTFNGVFREYTAEEDLTNCLVAAQTGDFAATDSGDYRFVGGAAITQTVKDFVQLPFAAMGRYEK